MNNVKRLLLLLHARRKIILLTLCVTVASTLIISLMMPKAYRASTTMVVNYRASDPVSGSTLPAQLLPGYMATQLDIVNSKAVALKVVDDLGLDADPAMRTLYMKETEGRGELRDWAAASLLKKMKATPARESSAISISYTDPDPRRAARVANAFGAAYQYTNVELKVDPSRKAALFFNDQIRELREKFEAAQARLSKYQLENGIVSPDSRIDVETTRLNELSSQLVSAQAQLMEARSRRKQGVASSADSPDVVANPVVQNLKAELSRAETKMAQVAERVMEPHPLYQQTLAEVNRLRASLKREIALVSSSLGNNERILQQHEADLRAALAAQKARVLDLNQLRDQLKVLANEADSAQRAYETASQRYLQNNLEGQSNQSDVAVLSAATVPLLPASPQPVRNSILSALLGLMLGIGLALLAEMMDRRVRSAYDLIEILQAPVLGVMVSDARRGSRFPLLPARLAPRLLTNQARGHAS